MAHDACSDERLIALLDGELPEREARPARLHLEACWQCRARLAELEANVHTVARAFCEGSWYSPAALERSRRQLHAAIAAEPVPRRRPALWRLAPFAAASLAFAGGAVWYAARPAPAPPAARPIAARPAAPLLPAPAPSLPAALPPRLPVLAAPVPDLTETLLDVYEALHRTAVCVREAAAVRVENGRVRVRILVDGVERRAEIETELARPDVDLEMTSMESAAAPQQEVVFVPSAGPEPASRRIPVHSEISVLLKPGADATDREVREFADAVLRASEAMNLQHQALLSLAEAFPPAVEAKLSANSRQRLRALAASHERQLAGAERVLRALLRPLLASDPALPHPASDSWQKAAQASPVPELHRTITRLFAVPLTESSGEAASLTQLTPLLAHPLTAAGDVLYRGSR
jgi:anti-sigma factor RsiW